MIGMVICGVLYVVWAVSTLWFLTDIARRWRHRRSPGRRCAWARKMPVKELGSEQVVRTAEFHVYTAWVNAGEPTP